MTLRIYIHRILLILTYTFLAVLLFGFLGQSFLSTIIESLDLILGVSMVALLRKVIASHNIRELSKICFSFAFIDWFLYTGNTQFKLNIKDRLKPVFEFRNYLWK